MSSERPNFLLIMTDQQRYDSLGCYGFAGAHTPNIDRLAVEGIVFDHCYVTNPICTPSRSSILTGKHLPGHGVYRLHDVLPEDEVLVTKRLQQSGYTTALIGKLHVSGRVYEGKNRHPNDGFDVYEWCMDPRMYFDSPFNTYSRWLDEQDPAFAKLMRDKQRRPRHIPRKYHVTHWAAERTIDFIERWDGNKPFFCLMSNFDPHSPYDDHPLEMRDLVDASRIPDPVGIPGETNWKPYGLRRAHDAFFKKRASRDISLETIKEERLGYYASIALLDLEIGRVLESLEKKGVAENTLVIFVSDHGDMLGDHELFRKGAFFYDPCVRVPLIMRWPVRLPGGNRVESLVQPHDLAATISAAAGYTTDELARAMPESRDLVPVAAGRQPRCRDYAVCCWRNSAYGDGDIYFDPPLHATMFRDERYKLSVYHDLQGMGLHSEGLLYDMQDDPDELHDLWNDPNHQGVKIRLLQRMLDWITTQELRLGSRGGEAPAHPGVE